METRKLYKRPFKLDPKRVRRTYKGGLNIDDWHNQTSEYGESRPEEWIASTVQAVNSGFTHEDHEGLSTIANNDEFLKDVIDKHPMEFLGKSHVSKYNNDMAILTKIIDASERLSIQVHPNKEYARTMFDSNYGKIEAWYILDTQTYDGVEPYVLMGFKPHVTKEMWEEVFYSQDIDKMISYLHKIKPEKGDVFYIEGGMPHAIGPGCMLLEIQEPTDYTLRVEKTDGEGQAIDDNLIHQGLGNEKMLECFNYQTYEYDEIFSNFMIPSKINTIDENVEVLNLIDECTTESFALDKINIKPGGSYKRDNDSVYSVLVIMSGDGIIQYDNEKLSVSVTNQILLPASLNSCTIVNNGDETLEIVLCKPPR